MATTIKVVHPGQLTMADAERFEKQLDAWADAACKSQETARAALVELGILTPTGRVAKRYSR